MDAKIEARFWKKVDISKNGCWNWIGTKDKVGYGRFHIRKKRKIAHRVSYEIAFDSPGTLHVLHKCDNKSCVRPDHLFLGTNRDNVTDRNQKGRTSHRISWDTVREIRRLFLEERMKIRDIEKKFQYVGVAAVVRNHLWYDPNYHPPTDRKGGPRSRLVEIKGHIKTMKEWTEDPLCQVALATLRKRYREGMRGIELLQKDTNRGRPRQ